MKAKPKILIVTSGIFAVPAVKGGSIETLVTKLLDMNEIEEKFEFVVGSRFENAAQVESKKYKHSKFIYYKKNHKFNLPYKCWAVFYYMMRFFQVHIPKFHYIGQLYQMTKNEDFDLILIEEGDAWAYNYLTKKFGREKMVYHSHSVLKADKYFEANYDSVIACSNYVLNENFSANEKYNHHKYVLINCINETVFSQKLPDNERNELRAKLGITQDELVYIFVGRISWDKGVLECIKAWQLANLTHAKLVVVGSALLNHSTLTPYEKEVQQEIAKSQNIIQCGFIPQNELYKYYQMSDVFVATSYKEAAGLMNIEAMFSSLPIISTNTGGVPEYVSHNRNGILLSRFDDMEEYVNALKLMAENPTLRSEFAKNNLIDCQKFTMAKYYDDFVKIIEQIQNQKDKPK